MKIPATLGSGLTTAVFPLAAALAYNAAHTRDRPLPASEAAGTSS